MSSKKLEFKMPDRSSPEKEVRHRRMRRVMENADVKRITVNVPSHIHNDFKVLCAKKRFQMKEIILRMVVNYLKTERI